MAAVRREASQKSNGGRDLAGLPADRLRAPASFRRQVRTGKNCRFSAIYSARFAGRKVDNRGSRRLYRFSWARRRLARWRVREAPHCSHGDRASGHAPDGHVRVAASDVRGSGFSGPAGAILTGTTGRKVPCCLTSESEERETWTAESLRAAFAIGATLSRNWPGRDFGGLTFQGFLHRPIAQAIGRVGTSSNVVISRDQISST